MDINDLRALGTVLVTLAFIGVCWWAFAPSRKQRFEEAAKLPFADDERDRALRQEPTPKPSAGRDGAADEHRQD